MHVPGAQCARCNSWLVVCGWGPQETRRPCLPVCVSPCVRVYFDDDKLLSALVHVCPNRPCPYQHTGYG